MKVLIGILIVFMLSACMTTYSIEKQTPDGNVTVLVKSFREFEQPNVQYSRTGDDVIFTFGAESATTATSPIEGAVAGVISAGGTIASSGSNRPEED